MRHAHLANILSSREGPYKIYGMFFEKDVDLLPKVHRSNDIQLVFPQSDIIVFPLPLLDSKGCVNTPLSKLSLRLEDCLDYIPPEAVVLAGKVPADIREMAGNRGIMFIDYLEREEFSVLNAVPTAEGAIEIAMRELPITLSGSTCLVLGYGRIGKVLARLLCAFGADVRVAARKYGDLAWIALSGCMPVHFPDLDAHMPDADILFNTVPAMLLDEKKLALLSRNCLVIDLASKPGGVDFETAKTLGLKTIWALSLPGKVAPITAGEITLNTILNILEERGAL